LLRGPGRAVRPGTGIPGHAAGPQPAVRPGCRGRVPALLHRHRGQRVLRNGGTPRRLRRLRRPERPGAASGPVRLAAPHHLKPAPPSTQTQQTQQIRKEPAVKEDINAELESEELVPPAEPKAAHQPLDKAIESQADLSAE